MAPGQDENANQPLNAANPIGNNSAVPFDLKEGPTDLRFYTDANSQIGSAAPRPDYSGNLCYTYGRMDLLGFTTSRRCGPGGGDAGQPARHDHAGHQSERRSAGRRHALPIPTRDRDGRQHPGFAIRVFQPGRPSQLHRDQWGHHHLRRPARIRPAAGRQRPGPYPRRWTSPIPTAARSASTTSARRRSPSIRCRIWEFQACPLPSPRPPLPGCR